jgi:putative restriction endonuclease
MAKLVLISNPISVYNDVPGDRYNFPNRSYLSTMAKAVGDWVVLYSGSKSSSPGFYAIQKIEKIVPDPVNAERSYAIVTPGSLWTFEQNVPRARPNCGRIVATRKRQAAFNLAPHPAFLEWHRENVFKG